MRKCAPKLLAAALIFTGAACTTAEPIADSTTLVQRAVAQNDIDPVKETVVGFWGEGGYLVRMGEQEFTVHTPQDGRIISRASVEGRLLHVGVSPDGSLACVVSTGLRGGGHTLSLYDAEADEFRWEKRLAGTSKLVTAGVNQCLVAFQGDQNPEVFEAADGAARTRLFETPEAPLGVFTSADGHRQWWFTISDAPQANHQNDEAVGGRPTRQSRQTADPVPADPEAAGGRPTRQSPQTNPETPDHDADGRRTTRASAAGTTWEVYQVDIRGWTLEGHVVASCFEADDVEFRVVPVNDSFDRSLQTMSRRSQLRANIGACEPAGPDEIIRFADGEHRLTNPERAARAERPAREASSDRELPGGPDVRREEILRDDSHTRRRPDSGEPPLSREEAVARERVEEAQRRGEQTRQRVEGRSDEDDESDEDRPRTIRERGNTIRRGADVIREFGN